MDGANRTRGGGYQVDPVRDLRPVCPNCHAMLHQRRPGPFGIEELKGIIAGASGPFTQKLGAVVDDAASWLAGFDFTQSETAPLPASQSGGEP